MRRTRCCDGRALLPELPPWLPLSSLTLRRPALLLLLCPARITLRRLNHYCTPPVTDDTDRRAMRTHSALGSMTGKLLCPVYDPLLCCSLIILIYICFRSVQVMKGGNPTVAPGRDSSSHQPQPLFELSSHMTCSKRRPPLSKP